MAERQIIFRGQKVDNDEWQVVIPARGKEE